MDIFSYMLGRKSGGCGSGGGSGSGSGGSDEDWIIGDGNTHIWITLTEGRTEIKLMLGGLWVAGIDWGDGTEEEIVSISNNSGQTIPHQYDKVGDYIISVRIVTDGSPYLCGNATSALVSGMPPKSYLGMLKKVEVGTGIKQLRDAVFYNCFGLESVSVPETLYSTSGVGSFCFYNCTALVDMVFSGSWQSVPIQSSMYKQCYSLKDIEIPEGTTYVSDNAFRDCWSLRRVVFPSTLMTIQNYAFSYCMDLQVLDFSAAKSVPSLTSKDAFDSNNISNLNLQIRVPAALVDEWKAATNWSTYADKIVGV